MKEIWKEIPTSFKIIWIGGAILSLSVTGFIIWVVVKLLQHWSII